MPITSGQRPFTVSLYQKAPRFQHLSQTLTGNLRSLVDRILFIPKHTWKHRQKRLILVLQTRRTLSNQSVYCAVPFRPFRFFTCLESRCFHFRVSCLASDSSLIDPRPQCRHLLLYFYRWQSFLVDLGHSYACMPSDPAGTSSLSLLSCPGWNTGQQVWDLPVNPFLRFCDLIFCLWISFAAVLQWRVRMCSWRWVLTAVGRLSTSLYVTSTTQRNKCSKGCYCHERGFAGLLHPHLWLPDGKSKEETAFAAISRTVVRCAKYKQ